MPATLVAPVRISAQQLIDEEYPNSKQDAPVADFAEEVERSLGYKVPNTVQFKEGKTPILLAMFQEHGFSLYRPSEVRKYRAQQVKKVEARANKWNRRRWKVATAFSGLGLLVSLCVMAITYGNKDEWGRVSDGFAAAGGAALIFAFFSILVLATIGSRYEKKAEWSSRRIHKDIGLGSRNIVIPETTLQLMMSIRRAVPDVEFELSELKLSYEPVFDPIVFAFIENEREFKAPIAIWEEPDFNGQLIDAASVRETTLRK